MLKFNLTTEAVEYLKYQRVLTQKLKHTDVEWYSYLLFHFIAYQFKPYLTPGSRCLDIGSGLGLVNYFLKDVYKEIWLYDKSVPVEELASTFYGFHKDYCFYNNLEVAKQINPDFNITESLDFAPQSFDMIHSHMSWCWHYPKDTYYEQIKTLLKPNGILVVDVLIDKNYTFPEFEVLAELENREAESIKYVLKYKN